MKPSQFSKLLIFTCLFGAILLIWSYQDQKDFDNIFQVIEGDLIPPVPIPDVKHYLKINNEAHGIFRMKLSTNNAKIALDSIIKPMVRARKVSCNYDTLPAIDKNTWNQFNDYFTQNAIRYDTFLIWEGNDTVPLKIREAVVFQAKYIFGVERHPYTFSLNIETEQNPELENIKELAYNEKRERLMNANLYDTLRFEEFNTHVMQVDNLFEDVDKIRISFKNVLRERHKAMGAVISNTKSPYMIETTNGWDLYRDETGFEILAMNDEYLSWRDSMFHVILFWFFVVVWFYLAFRSYLSYKSQKEQSSN